MTVQPLSFNDLTLWDDLPAMAVLLAADGRVLRCNRAFKQYLACRVPALTERIDHECQWLTEHPAKPSWMRWRCALTFACH